MFYLVRFIIHRCILWHMANVFATGSPIGKSFALFLVQHKAELGIKMVKSVTIFRDRHRDTLPRVQLLFTIEDWVDPNQPEPSNPGKGEEEKGSVRRSVQVSGSGKISFGGMCLVRWLRRVGCECGTGKQ